MRVARFRIVAGVVLATCLFLLLAQAVFAQQEITSTAGPLTRIITTPDLACQVAHREDELFEFYPASSEVGNCGTFMAIGGTVYGPAGGNPTGAAWTALNQASAVGAGTSGDPFRVVTAVDAQPAGVRVVQSDSYVVGSQSYRTDIQVTNGSAEPRVGTLYRAGDCYLQGSDQGFVRVDGGAPACIVDPAQGRRIEQWLPITPGSHFYAGFYEQVWALIRQQEQFPDQCACTETSTFDNGAGLSWPINLAPGQSLTVSHETFFSPVGRGPVQESFTDSVPDPTRITLDPIVVAQSVAITAGVVLLIPFPSALFNATLEENYDEVMSGIAKIRAWLAAVGASLLASIRAFISSRRGLTGPAPPVPPEQQPLIAPVDYVEPIAAQPVSGLQSAVGQAPPTVAKPDLWSTPLGILGFVLLSAFLYAFLDPTFGFSLTSVATFVGLAIGLFIVLAAYGGPLIAFARSHRVALSVRALPATLLIGVLCVIVSRLADFQPGYLYGLIIGFLFVRGVEMREEGRAEAIAAGSSLAVAFVAWIVLALVRGAGGVGGDLSTALIEAAAVTTVVAGLENAVFAMLPLRFLPGAVVYKWNRRVWALLISVGLFGFAHVLLNPAAGAGYMADTSRTPFFTLVALLVAFGLASVLFWAWFRFRPKRQAHV